MFLAFSYQSSKNYAHQFDQMILLRRHTMSNLKAILFLSLLFITVYLLFRTDNSDEKSIADDRNPFLKKANSRFGERYKPKCKRKNVKFSDKPLIRIALASYPGAGNTWVRDLIQQVTGIATGSVYCDQSLQEFFIGECETNNKTIVIKTQEWYDKYIYKKAIILIRSPLKSFAPHFSDHVSADPSVVADRRTYKKHFKTFLKKMLPHWRWYNEEWMNDFKRPKYIMFYDRLKTDLSGEMRKLMKFLNFEYDESDFQCMLMNYETLAQRKSTQKINILEYFSPEQLKKAEEDILHIENMASKINGEYHKIERHV